MAATVPGSLRGEEWGVRERETRHPPHRLGRETEDVGRETEERCVWEGRIRGQKTGERRTQERRDSGQCGPCVFGVILCSGQSLPLRYTQVQAAPAGSATNPMGTDIPDVHVPGFSEALTPGILGRMWSLSLLQVPSLLWPLGSSLPATQQNLTLFVVYLVQSVSLA